MRKTFQHMQFYIFAKFSNPTKAEFYESEEAGGGPFGHPIIKSLFYAKWP